jgi:hypothetical protein
MTTGASSISAARGAAFAALLAWALPAAAQSGCGAWDVSGIRTIEQGNGIRVNANLQQAGDTVTGTATWTQTVSNSRETYSRAYDAGVEGALDGDRFDVVMTWNNGSVGVYSGTIDAQGFVASGLNYDRRRPDVRVTWRNVEPFRCRPKPNAAAAPPLAIHQPKPLTPDAVRRQKAAAGAGYAKPPPRDLTRVTPEPAAGAEPEPPPAAPAPPPVARERLAFGDREFLYGVEPTGTVVQYVDRPEAGSTAPERRTFDHGATVASDWRRIVGAYPAWAGTTGAGAGFAVFALTADGVLNWYRHDGFPEGRPYWSGPIPVATGWNRYSRIFSGGDGVLYGITPEGELLWHRYRDVASARTPPRWEGPLVVGTGWDAFVHVFSGGDGVVYAVRPDGTLLWFRHVSHRTGVASGADRNDAAVAPAARWEGPRVVGSGWQQFRTIVSPGNGFIYAVNTNGDVQWYLHAGFRDGSPSWQGPVKRASGWEEYAVLVTLMRGTQQERPGE